MIKTISEWCRCRSILGYSNSQYGFPRILLPGVKGVRFDCYTGFPCQLCWWTLQLDFEGQINPTDALFAKIFCLLLRVILAKSCKTKSAFDENTQICHIFLVTDTNPYTKTLVHWLNNSSLEEIVNQNEVTIL